MKITIEKAKTLAENVLLKKGYTEAEAEVIASSLLWAQLRGSTQGLTKLFGWRSEKREDAKEPSIEKQEDNCLLINAHFHSHIIACHRAVQQILSQMKRKKIVIAGIKNTDNSAGALGFFTEKLAKAGYVAIMMSAADPGVVAYGGKTRMFGTNPISIAVPTKNNPIILDMSTAALTWGDLIRYNIEGKPLPEGFAFDKDGKPTTDPKAAMDGSVTTFDKSYKSSGLSLMIQILAGPLVGSMYSKEYKDFQYGSLLIAINPTSFGDEDLFLERVGQMVKDIKESEKAEGFDEILLPGEKGYKIMEEALSVGEIEISDDLFGKVLELQ